MKTIKNVKFAILGLVLLTGCQLPPVSVQYQPKADGERATWRIEFNPINPINPINSTAK